MAKIKKSATDKKVVKHKKRKLSDRPLNAAIKKCKGINNKKRNIKDLPKHKKYHRPKSLKESSVKNEHNGVKNSGNGDKNGINPHAFEANSSSSTHNNTSFSSVKKVKHKNRKFLLPLRERMLNQLKAARFR